MSDDATFMVSTLNDCCQILHGGAFFAEASTTESIVNAIKAVVFPDAP
jgi:hypothetical protein